MADVPIPPDQVQDPRELNEPGLGLGRDPVRTPMAWDAGTNAGFTRGRPWLPLHADWEARNVAAQRETPGSMWRLYRDLLALRRARPALSIGAWLPIECTDGVLAYARCHGDERLLVVLNLTDRPQPFAIPEWAEGLPVLLAAQGGNDPALLGPDEGLVLG